MICENDKHRIKPDVVMDDNGLHCYYCKECYKTFDSLMVEYTCTVKLKVDELVVKTAKIDVLIEYINNKNSQGCFEYTVYSELFNMIENLKKGG